MPTCARVRRWQVPESAVQPALELLIPEDEAVELFAQMVAQMAVEKMNKTKIFRNEGSRIGKPTIETLLPRP